MEPEVGDQVQITDGEWEGHVGKVIKVEEAGIWVVLQTIHSNRPILCPPAELKVLRKKEVRQE